MKEGTEEVGQAEGDQLLNNGHQKVGLRTYPRTVQVLEFLVAKGFYFIDRADLRLNQLSEYSRIKLYSTCCNTKQNEI